MRRGHHRRAALLDAMDQAISAAKWRWWKARWRLAEVAGDAEAARIVAGSVARDALRELRALGGLAVVEETPAPPPPTVPKARPRAKRARPRTAAGRRHRVH